MLSFMQTDATAVCGTSSFCSARADHGWTLQANVGGTPGTVHSDSVNPGSLNEIIVWWECAVGDGAIWAAGNWTVRINVTVANTNISITEIYICRVNAACTSVGTVGSLTGQSVSVGTTGVKTFTVSGLAVAAPSAGDKVVVLVVGTNTAGTSQSYSFDNAQLIDSPFYLSTGWLNAPEGAEVVPSVRYTRVEAGRGFGIGQLIAAPPAGWKQADDAIPIRTRFAEPFPMAGFGVGQVTPAVSVPWSPPSDNIIPLRNKLLETIPTMGFGVGQVTPVALSWFDIDQDLDSQWGRFLKSLQRAVTGFGAVQAAGIPPPWQEFAEAGLRSLRSALMKPPVLPTLDARVPEIPIAPWLEFLHVHVPTLRGIRKAFPVAGFGVGQVGGVLAQWTQAGLEGKLLTSMFHGGQTVFSGGAGGPFQAMGWWVPDLTLPLDPKIVQFLQTTGFGVGQVPIVASFIWQIGPADIGILKETLLRSGITPEQWVSTPIAIFIPSTTWNPSDLVMPQRQRMMPPPMAGLGVGSSAPGVVVIVRYPAWESIIIT